MNPSELIRAFRDRKIKSLNLLRLLPSEVILRLAVRLGYPHLCALTQAEPSFEFILHDEPFWIGMGKKHLSVDLREDPAYQTYGSIPLQFFALLSKKRIIEGSELFLHPDFCLDFAIRTKDRSLASYFTPLVSSARLDKAAYEFARQGDLPLLNQAIGKGASIDSALKGAIEAPFDDQQEAIIESLVAQGASLPQSYADPFVNPNFRPKKGKEKPLEKSQGAKKADQLLKQKNDAALHFIENANNDLGQAIHQAALGNQQIAVNALIELGASKVQALEGAARGGHFNLVVELLYGGTIPSCFALLNAIESQNFNIVELLLPKVKSGFPAALMRATILGNVEIVRLLLAKKVFLLDDLNIARGLAKQSRHAELVEIFEMRLSGGDMYSFPDDLIDDSLIDESIIADDQFDGFDDRSGDSD
jgi:hypothetical protein